MIQFILALLFVTLLFNSGGMTWYLQPIHVAKIVSAQLLQDCKSGRADVRRCICQQCQECGAAKSWAVRGITTASVPMSVPLYKKGQEEHFQCSRKLPQEGNRCVCFLANFFITYLTARGGLWNPPNLSCGRIRQTA